MKNWIYIALNFLRRIVQRLLNTATVGVKALIINQEFQVLLVEHTYTKGWHLPGGGVGPGENPIDAIIREVAEETAINTLKKPELFAVYVHQILGAPDYPILYIVKDFETIPNPKPCPEIKQAAWFAIDNLPVGTTDSTRQRINEVLNKVPITGIW